MCMELLLRYVEIAHRAETIAPGEAWGTEVWSTA